MLDYGLWAAGALTIGLGIVPTIAGLASLVRPRGEAREAGRAGPRGGDDGRGRRASASTRPSRPRTCRPSSRPSRSSATSSTSSRSSSPERRCSSSAVAGGAWAVVAAGGFALYLVRGDAVRARRSTRTTRLTVSRSSRSRTASSGGRPPRSSMRSSTVTIAATVLLVLVSRIRGRAAVALVAAARSDDAGLDGNSRGLRGARREPVRRSASTTRCPSPPTGSTARPHGSPVIFLGHAVKDPNPVHLLEFWNRAVTGVWSLDGTAPRSGRDADAQPRATGRDAHRTPDRLRPDGARGRHRRPPARSDRSVAISSCRLPDRQAPPPHRPDGNLSGRMDGRSRHYAATTSTAGSRARPGSAVARGLVRQGQAGQRHSSRRHGRGDDEQRPAHDRTGSCSEHTGVIHSCQVPSSSSRPPIGPGASR